MLLLLWGSGGGEETRQRPSSALSQNKIYTQNPNSPFYFSITMRRPNKWYKQKFGKPWQHDEHLVMFCPNDLTAFCSPACALIRCCCVANRPAGNIKQIHVKNDIFWRTWLVNTSALLANHRHIETPQITPSRRETFSIFIMERNLRVPPELRRL
jgi:hypothetical protein